MIDALMGWRALGPIAIVLNGSFLILVRVNHRMLIIYAPEPHVRSLIDRVVGKRRSSLLHVSDWQGVHARAPDAECLVLAFEWLDAVTCEQIRVLKGRLFLPPLVLVVGRELGSGLRRQPRFTESIVCLEEVDTHLMIAIGAAPNRSIFERQARRTEELRELHPRLRQALALAYRAEIPIRSVEDLARWVGRDRRILYSHWKASGGAPSLKEVLDWILIARALTRKSLDRSWESVAEGLECPLVTLSRTASRRAGMTLTELSAVGRHFVLERIEDLSPARSLGSARGLPVSGN